MKINGKKRNPITSIDHQSISEMNEFALSFPEKK